MSVFGSILRPLMSMASARPATLQASNIAQAPTSSITSTLTSMILTRNLTKTHRATYRRFRKTATNGYKRGLPGRKHGNAGWGRKLLNEHTGTAYTNDSQTKRLKRLLPNI